MQELLNLVGVIKVFVPDICGELIELRSCESRNPQKHPNLGWDFPMEEEILLLFRQGPFSDYLRKAFPAKCPMNWLLHIPPLRYVYATIVSEQLKELFGHMLPTQ